MKQVLMMVVFGSFVMAAGCSMVPPSQADWDGDGYCEGADTNLDGELTCDNDFWEYEYEAQPGDCDDEDPEVYPGAEEICDDKDNDCDGEIDNDCVDLGDDDSAE